MRLLLDECTPVGLIKHFVGVEVDHVTTIGWSGTKNGKLLARMTESGYAGWVTADGNLVYQQQVNAGQIFVIVLVARTNRLADLAPLILRAISQAQEAKPGEVRHIQ